MAGSTNSIEFLARSHVRVRILGELERESELTRADLKRAIDADRTTIQRNLGALCDRGWVRNSGRTYSITACGALVAEDMERLVETVRASTELRPVLTEQTRSILNVELDALLDADIYTAAPGDPWAMVNRHVNALSTTDEFRAILPLVGLHAMEMEHERATERGGSSALIVTPEVAETFRSNSNYRQYVEELVDHDRYRISVTTDEIPCYVGLLDETVQIGVDDDGQPRALLESANPEMVDWATRTIDSYRTDATPFAFE